MEKASKSEFDVELHKSYLYGFLNYNIPSCLSYMDANRAVLLYFVISGLDILDEAQNISIDRKNTIIDWIYSLQVKNEQHKVSGFQGSTTMNLKGFSKRNTPYKWCHIAHTYSSLITLILLGDDLSRVHRKEIISSLRTLQLSDGSFKGAVEGAENDMRFVFCAASICYILNDWDGIDIEKMVNFILNSISYDGGIAQAPGLESHCGSTFCAVAALALTKNLHRLSDIQKKNLTRWLVNRLEFGFNGRPNKPADTCYSFWTGGALKILDAYDFISTNELREFVLTTQDKYGGFAKWANTIPDPMHTYFGLAGLSLMGESDLMSVFTKLNTSVRVSERLRDIQNKWA